MVDFWRKYRIIYSLKAAENLKMLMHGFYRKKARVSVVVRMPVGLKILVIYCIRLML